ncbi:MAG: hypothetical protein KF709_01095 [Gemmatimonadaceae bacterium]|nr:hypothetical protein [Gemmatimonadaceae bacterium]
MLRHGLRSLALGAAVLAAPALVPAQSDFGSPTGAGGGVTAALAPYVPSTGRGNALSPSGSQALGGAIVSFAGAPSDGVSIINPAGGVLNLPQSAAQALGAVLGGQPTAAQSAALNSALGPVPAAQATALSSALAALGGGPNVSTARAAVAAYNAAVRGLPAGANPPPALLAARFAIAQAIR